MTFPQLIKKLRKQHGLSQRELASRIGVNFTYISKLESGTEPPPSELTLINMARVFEVNRYDFILKAGKVPLDFHSLILSNEIVRDYLKVMLKDGDNNVRKEET